MRPESRRLDQVIAIFATCVRVRATARTLLRQADAIALNALNIGLVASRSATRRGTFMVLADEARQSARDVTTTVHRLQAATDALAYHALAAVEQVRLRAKLGEARSRMTRPHNVAVARLFDSRLDQRIQSLLGRLAEARAALDAHAATLEAYNQRLGVIASRVRLESAVAGVGGSRLSSLCDQLDAACKALRQTSYTLHDMSTQLGDRRFKEAAS